MNKTTGSATQTNEQSTNRILVLFAHPNQPRSNVNGRMADRARNIAGVTVVDLYAEYPRYKIDVKREQQRLIEHDIIVFQFPFHWYSTPALLKEWQDLVLEFGFAYGSDGNALAGKCLLVATTAGGSSDAYMADGQNRFPVRALLAPLEQTANLCQMKFLPPLVLHSALAAATDGRGDAHIDKYDALLNALYNGQLDLTIALQQDLIDVPAIPMLEAQ